MKLAVDHKSFVHSSSDFKTLARNVASIYLTFFMGRTVLQFFERVLLRGDAFSQLKKRMIQVEAGIEADFERFVAARRDLLSLWAAKHCLWRSIQAKFPHTHPLCKTVFGLCYNDATCRIRHLCDIAICRCADRYGDEPFQDKIVDGVHIPAVTHWFYGISGIIPRENVVLDPQGRSKRLTRVDVQCFDDVYHLGRRFIENASALPFLPKKSFDEAAKRFEEEFAEAKAKIGATALVLVKDSPTMLHDRA